MEALAAKNDESNTVGIAGRSAWRISQLFFYEFIALANMLSFHNWQFRGGFGEETLSNWRCLRTINLSRWNTCGVSTLHSLQSWVLQRYWRLSDLHSLFREHNCFFFWQHWMHWMPGGIHCISTCSLRFTMCCAHRCPCSTTFTCSGSNETNQTNICTILSSQRRLLWAWTCWWAWKG